MPLTYCGPVAVSDRVICSLRGRHVEGSRCGPGSHGITIIELLVAIGIIALLAMLLLPAVQAARESSRRNHCLNNLRQIGVGLQAYHGTHQTLPPGFIADATADQNNMTDPTADGSGWAWSAMLLPFIEQGNVHQKIDFRRPVSDPFNVIREQSLSLFLCPSDTVDTTWSPTMSAANPITVSSSNYVGVTGTMPEIAEAEGVFFRNSWVPFSDIMDGLSNTLLAGERWHSAGQATWSGVLREGGVPEHVLGHTGRSSGPGGQGSGTNEFFSSHSGGGAQFVFADGHAAFLPSTIDIDVYMSLATRAGSEGYSSQW